VLKTFRHKGLKRLFEKDDPRGIRPEQLNRLRDVLANLDCAVTLKDLDLPGYRLHELKGNLANHWSITISGYWRVTFRFEDGDAIDVDFLDYH
jgi:proteic killer suppression protein